VRITIGKQEEMERLITELKQVLSHLLPASKQVVR
jgi:histidinol-phosphate/aromatic aminotransferase/cobyric acid decarboxylase-like protein